MNSQPDSEYSASLLSLFIVHCSLFSTQAAARDERGGDAHSCHRNQQILVTLMCSPRCQTSHSVVGRAILIPTVRRAWDRRPDELASTEALRDLGYAPTVGLAEMVAIVLEAHEARRAQSRAPLFAARTLNAAGQSRVTLSRR